MTKEEIIEEIIATNCNSRKHTSRLMKLIESSKKNVRELLEIAFEHDDFLSFRGGRVLKFICKQTLTPIIRQPITLQKKYQLQKTTVSEEKLLKYASSLPKITIVKNRL